MVEKLSKNYVHAVGKGCIVITRLSDGESKIFNMVNIKTNEGSLAVMNFMNSLTDELMESYFPKPRKK